MALIDDLKKEVDQIFGETWETRNGTVVPSSENLGLYNQAVKLNATVLYADLSESTSLVDSYPSEFAAEIYKTYLHCASKIIRIEGGVITSYDGDRVMAVYLGDQKNSSAVRSALKINATVKLVINTALKNQYPEADYEVRQIVGIDTSDLFIARTGIRGSNDLVWVGRAANHAAKLSALSGNYSTCISKHVYKKLPDKLKYSEGESFWQKATWTSMENIEIYRTKAWWNY
ncbi:MAG TPA: adenylate/guanylate cyclase domain-containing protein [Pyrinomonadaceae bacterium]|jgi:class 3 adenylate cyclase|nr:adenylate/guanylate cyclase domain-containing protein [Pyrinomonadaceae bacterium]